MSLAYFAIGFSPITALALTLFGLWPLNVGALVIVLPSVMLVILMGLKFPRHGLLSLIGWGMGLTAVSLYDLTRLPFIWTGIWRDFIPNIGGLLLGMLEPNWLAGYLWRYLGNGGGMGLAFTVVYSLLKPKVERRAAGLLFGVGVWACLMITLLFSANGMKILFTLTPTKVAISLVGHVVYGAVLGILLHVLKPERVLMRRAPAAGNRPGTCHRD